jgi:uncharacterized MAPEG superfamily protein
MLRETRGPRKFSPSHFLLPGGGRRARDSAAAVVYRGGRFGSHRDRQMATELQYLAWAAILTLLLRVPWMVDKVRVRGLAKVSRYPKDSEPLSDWGHRAWIAHEDAVHNLVVFAALVLVLVLAGESNAWTRGAAAVYFWARLAHALVYLFAIPRLKTAAFLVGFAAQLVLAWQLL